MSEETTITILNEEIPFVFQRVHIHRLKYFKDNPRIYSVLQGLKQQLPSGDALQILIQDEMWKEPSVKNLIPEIRHHGGVTEAVLVMQKTMEVIEGNSRLAALRQLSRDDPDNEKWGTIPCKVVSELTPAQLDSYLHQTHVIGVTPWTAFEKANLAYKRVVEDGELIEKYADNVSESVQAIRKRISIIELMLENDDRERRHFSYYDVLTKSRAISGARAGSDALNTFLLQEIKKQTPGNETFTAADMRDKLPDVLKKPKQVKKFIGGKVSLDDAYQNAKLSSPHETVKSAREKITSVEKKDIEKLPRNEINALLQETSKCERDASRLHKMVNQRKDDLVAGRQGHA